MTKRRVDEHPVLSARAGEPVHFSFRGRALEGCAGEPIASALLAAGERVLGHHRRDGAPLGLFCASGQCAQCMVLLDGRPVKACVTRLSEGARVEPLDGVPVLPRADAAPPLERVERLAVRALVVGGGPAGLAAAHELGRLGVETLVVDDKPDLGGKLVLQTHRFFGSTNAVHAGTRGFDIAARLEREAREHASVRLWADTAALAVFSDGVVGLLRTSPDGPRYLLVRPEVLVVATGARERSLAFAGNTLPGVMGAGAFQTLLHRDRVRPAERVLVVGGGNVGLIVAYQARQAGIEVAAVVEARERCGGYRVHHDKLERLGVPILTRTTIVAARGREGVEAVTVAEVDASYRVVPGTERELACDAVLLALGFDPEDELFHKARELGLRAFVAGDASEVAEASAAIFSGRLAAHDAAHALGVVGAASASTERASWQRALAIHKSRPGPALAEEPAPTATGLLPVIHCIEEIPCDPCASVCPQGGLRIDPDDIRHLPAFVTDALERPCVGCEKCVTICPGQAITLLDERSDPEHPTVVVPFELDRRELAVGSRVTAVDVHGEALGEVEVLRVRDAKVSDHTLAVKLRVPRAIARRVAGIRVGAFHDEPTHELAHPPSGPTIVCRCERVTAGEVTAAIRAGNRDLFALKALTRVGMGACGARTCGPLVRKLLVDEGVEPESIEEPRHRPLLFETPLAVLASDELGPEGRS